ncbi:MAG TPA: universal stress protein [Planctomycetota bacterium]
MGSEMNGDGPRVLIPLDGSALSAWALDRVSGLLARMGATATLLGVVEEPAADLAFRVDPRHAEVAAALGAQRDRLIGKGVSAQAELRFGDPAEAILREIGEGGHRLVAMSTHGRTGLARVLFGSVAAKVLRGSAIPALLFRPMQAPDGTLSPAESREPVDVRRVLVLLDGSPLSEEILAPAVDLARRLGAELRLFTAVDREALARAAEERLDDWSGRISAGGVATSIDVRHGAAATEAMEAAREWGADLVALTTHGRTGAARALVGSVAERILRDDTAGPLLVLRSRILAGAVVPGPEAGPVVHVT